MNILINLTLHFLKMTQIQFDLNEQIIQDYTIFISRNAHFK